MDDLKAFLKDSSGMFSLTFTYNDTEYTSTFVAKRTPGSLLVENSCISMELDKDGFNGNLESDISGLCFTPRLVTNARDKPGKRTTSADVLLILLTKLGLAFPTTEPITIFDGARKLEVHPETAPTMISPFNLLRGRPAFYEKYGYVSDKINRLKKELKGFKWNKLSPEVQSLIDASGTTVIDVMKNVSWNDEIEYNNSHEKSLSYTIFRDFAEKKGITRERSSQFSRNSIWKFTLDQNDPRWIQSDKDLMITQFVVQKGGRKTRHKKVRSRRRLL